jgi:LacI family transcriptional regulator
VGKNRTTIHDIARELNITASTVSRALNGHATISEKTRKAVLEKARQLNYKPNSIAAALRSGRSYIIGVIVPVADRSFFAKVVRSIEEEAAEAGYSVIICQTYENFEKEKQVLDTLLRTQVDGIIASIAKGSTTFDHYQRVLDEGVPVILFDRKVESLAASTVTIDDFRGAYTAVEHLIEQGCRRIAHFAGQQHIRLYQERYRGYREALRYYGLPFEESLVFECPSDVELGRKSAERLLQLSPRPDAIFSSSDYAALGAMQRLKSEGVAIPGEIAIVGFANEPFTSFIEPALTTVDQHSNRMGQYAARTFLAEIDREKEVATTRKVLQPELIVRASSLKKN